MRLYAANTTKKNQQFQYRIPTDEGGGLSQRVYDVTIPPGSQREIHPLRDEGMTSFACNSLVNQLRRKFNAVEAGDRPQGYVGVAYSVDKPVKEQVIRDGLHANDKVLTEQGEKLRQESAIATRDVVANATGDDPNNLAELEVSIQEEAKPGEEPKVDQTTLVARDGESGGTKDKPSTQRRKRK